MTDRIHSITLVLDKNIRIDDAESLIAALGLFGGVIEVIPNVACIEDAVAESRVRQELGLKLWAILYPKTAQP